jgi:hypothetical protein
MLASLLLVTYQVYVVSKTLHSLIVVPAFSVVREPENLCLTHACLRL